MCIEDRWGVILALQFGLDRVVLCLMSKGEKLERRFVDAREKEVRKE